MILRIEVLPDPDLPMRRTFFLAGLGFGAAAGVGGAGGFSMTADCAL